MKYFVLGGNGLIGSSIIKELLKKKQRVFNINRANYKKFINKRCDIFIYANGNSNKYFAKQNPFLDFEFSVSTVIKSINDFHFKKFIFLSSCDVYDKISKTSTSENTLITKSNNFYGKNKYISESIVKSYCKKWLIIRMGPLIGSNLKKNAIFNLINNKKVYANIFSRSSFILTETVSKILLRLIDINKNEIFNISARDSISFKTIKKKMKSKSVFVENKRRDNYIVNIRKIEKYLNVRMPNSIEEINVFKKTFNN
jgi:nucleoside-diphosphate-sugar epimerase